MFDNFSVRILNKIREAAGTVIEAEIVKIAAFIGGKILESSILIEAEGKPHIQYRFAGEFPGAHIDNTAAEFAELIGAVGFTDRDLLH